MPENTSSVKPDLGSLIGTKEILSAVVGKLSSQLLLFSIAIVVLLLIAYAMWGSEGLIPAAGILFIFLVGTVGYLFFEQKQKLQNGDPGAVNKVLGDKMKQISASQDTNVNNESGKDLKIELWTEKFEQKEGSRDINIIPSHSAGNYKIGDKININFKSNRDCFLTLLNIGTSGKLTMLYPNSVHKDNFIKGDLTYKIPGDEYGFEYHLSGPEGTEKLKAIVTENKINLLEENFASDGSLFKTTEPKAAARDIQIIKNKVENIAPGKWNEAYYEFKVHK